MNINKKAEDFCLKYGVIVKIELAKNPKTPLWAKDGENYGLQYNITIERNGKKWEFPFWDSIHNKEGLEDIKKAKNLYGGGYFKGIWRNGSYIRKWLKDNPPESFQPTTYDILACITKDSPGSFKNFCDSFGYDTDSIRARDIYIAVGEEWENCERIFGDIINELREIC